MREFAVFSLFQGKTPPIRSKTGRSIAVLERIGLGGIDQWATIRGHDTENPIRLHVHGGPGMSEMGAIRHFVPELEEHFRSAAQPIPAGKRDRAPEGALRNCVVGLSRRVCYRRG